MCQVSIQNNSPASAQTSSVAKDATTSFPLTLEANGTIEAIPKIQEKVAILNFANEFTVAGGYRLAGRKTQEAALCR